MPVEISTLAIGPSARGRRFAPGEGITNVFEPLRGNPALDRDNRDLKIRRSDTTTRTSWPRVPGTGKSASLESTSC